MNTDIGNNYSLKSPYPGINPFSYAGRDLFFAREKEAHALIRLIVMYRGVLLYSASGVGKSSLINSGLIPLAMKEDYQPERVRVQPRKGAEIIVERLSKSVDGKPPFLPSIFISDDRDERTVLSIENFLEVLRKSRQNAGTTHPLIIFDQFEEWVTLFEENPSGQTIEDVRSSKENIQKAITSIINEPELPVKILISLREDYIARLAPFFKQCPNLPDHYVRLESLKNDQIFTVIRGPFDHYPGRFQPEISSALAMKIQEQFKEKMKGEDVSLTEVQVTCKSLFDSGKSGQELEAFFFDQGGVKGILEHYLERVLESIETEQRDAAIALLSKMVTSAGTRNVISEDDLLERVSSETNMSHELLSTTLSKLEQETKLVRREQRHDVYYYEIASEFLIGWIRQKAFDRQRLLNEKKLLEAQQVAEEERRKAERQRLTNKKLKYFSMSLIVLALLLGFISCYLVLQYFLNTCKFDDYYNKFSVRKGLPVGIGMLTSEQIKHRAVSFKLTKKGYKNPYTTVVAVNGIGEPTPYHGVNPYLQVNSNVNLLSACRWEFVIDSRMSVIYQKEYNKYDKMVRGLVYSPHEEKGLKVLAHYVGSDGYPKPDKNSSTEFVEFDYRTKGVEVLHYSDREHNPQPGPFKQYGRLNKFNAQGLIIKSTSLDKEGTPMNDEYGNASWEITDIDQLGNILEQEMLDNKGNKIIVRDGWAKVNFQYDSNGNCIGASYFDTKNKPTQHKDGYHRMTIKRDDLGNEIEAAYFDVAGKPTKIDGGYHRITGEYDKHGNCKEIKYFDTAGNPIKDRLYRITINHDEPGRSIEYAYFDTAGNPVKDGLHRMNMKYNEDGNSTEKVFYYSWGKRIERYDERGNCIEWVFFDAQGHPKNYKNGYYRITSKYDKQGKYTERVFYNAGGKHLEKYDKNEKVIEWTDYNSEGKLIDRSNSLIGK